MQTRRQFLGTGLAAAAACAARPALAAAPEELRAMRATAQLVPADWPATEVFAYNGRIPGPEIRLPQGARLVRRLVNDLPEPTAIHWHGIRIDNAMDGVPGLTQDAVPPGGRFDYDFALPDAGTFWYHTHNRSWEQLARGLAGPLVVTEAAPPEVDADRVIFVADWRLGQDAQLTADFGAMHDRAHAGRIGNVVTVNGAFEFREPVRRHDRLRLRLANACTARILRLGLQGAEGWVVALDGMPLAAPEPAGEVVLAPAQRADLIVDVTAEPGGEAVLVGYERDGGFALASFAVASGSSRRRPPPAALPPNALAPVDLARAGRVALRMEGGAMRGLPEGADHDGRTLGMRALMQAGQVWAFNGVAGMPAAPLFALARGATVRIPIVNDTAFPHGIHTHGHHFREVRGEALGPWRDTILLAPGETREIAMVGDNPGNWLLHCHMLDHQAAGMKTWFQVA